jgi:hypothetical protein
VWSGGGSSVAWPTGATYDALNAPQPTGTITLDAQGQAFLDNLNSYLQIHGNSAAHTGAQHGYGIFDHLLQDYYKFGISGQKLNKDGTSPRANKQANNLNKSASGRYSARVLKKNLPGRKKALNWEYGKVNGYKKSKSNPTKRNPRGQKLPNP